MTSVATANLGNRKDKAILRGLKRLAKKVAVIGVQESGDRRRVIEQFCRETGWEVFWGEGAGAASVAILWDPAAVLVSEPGTRPCTDPTDCGNCGVGPDVVKAKVWNKIRVHPRNGDDPFVFINGHLPASLYCECRDRLSDVMIEELADMVERRKDRIDVVAVMDGNSRPTASRWKPLKHLGMKQRTWFPTHTVRIIDLTWTLGRKAKARAFGFKFSDHTWVILRLS